MGSPALPTLEYLFECSDQSLHDLELAALDRSAQCLRKAKEEWMEGAAQRESAGVARWLITNRAGILEMARRTVDAQTAIPFPQARRRA